MATYRAISAVSDAIVHMLESQYSPEDFDGNLLQFTVYLAPDFTKPMEVGVSVFPYRICFNRLGRVLESIRDIARSELEKVPG